MDAALALSCHCSESDWREEEYFLFKDRLIRGLLRTCNRTSEPLLIAIFFAIQCCALEGLINEVTVHQGGFIDAFSRLIGDGTAESRLSTLYPYLPTTFRGKQVILGSKLPLAEPFVIYEARKISEILASPMHVSDLRITMGFPARYWLRRRVEPNLTGSAWSLCDDKEYLYSCLNLCVTDKGVEESMSKIITSLYKNVEDMVKLDQVSYLFENVHSNFGKDLIF